LFDVMIPTSTNDLNGIEFVSRDVGMNGENNAQIRRLDWTDNETTGLRAVPGETGLLRFARNDAEGAVVPRACGVSSTSCPFGSTSVSGTLDHPHARVITTAGTTLAFTKPAFIKHDFAFPWHDAPEFCPTVSPPKNRGRRECRVPDAPAARVQKIAHGRHHRLTGLSRHSLRNGFNDLLRALPGDEFVLSPSSAN
jgi:hypothetical protein